LKIGKHLAKLRARIALQWHLYRTRLWSAAIYRINYGRPA